ncbi:hypothetical protein BXU11_01250 [Flavobacterium sp. LM5]|uniref:hypothetical protein n=1 Tax=Flavobacterium sp. LM5 TaxID=1938610 RepID=UPI00099462ED|nr:hypothetical protein [Flavobacterium sp. LM5]OOV28606.1 hypothetical protein BXU11_01250 [Flavobacterium sp. LM5]
MAKKRNSISFIIKLKSIKREIKFAFFISLLSILTIEILFKNFSAPSHSFYIIGDIYLKICYSIVATSIFFLINQHLPKEDRNLKTNKYIRSKLVYVNNELVWLSEMLNINNRDLNLTEEIINEACKNINPASQVTESRINSFVNWREYLKYKTDKIKLLLTEVMILNSTIETELLGHIVNMLDAIDQFYHLNNRTISLGKDLSFYSNAISYLFEENYKIFKIIDTGKYKIYTNTNMNEYINKKLKK